MNSGFKALIAAGVMAAGLGTTAASAMPVAMAAPQADVVVHADKTAVVCIGRCYRRFGYGYGYYRPAYRAYAYRPYAMYRPHRLDYYRY